VKRLALAAAGLVWLAAAPPADAYLVEVTTSVAVSDADDHSQIKRALQSAVDEVLKDAIAFEPTMVVVTRALVVGERLYIRLLIADRDGEQRFKDLAEPDGDRAVGSGAPKVEL
jgi:hypothetical protein